MAIAGLLLGMVLGSVFLSHGGAIIGAVLGWLIGREREQNQRITSLEHEIDRLLSLQEEQQVVVRVMPPTAAAAAKSEQETPVEPEHGPRPALAPISRVEPQSEALRHSSVAPATVSAAEPVPAAPPPFSIPPVSPSPPLPPRPAMPIPAPTLRPVHAARHGEPSQSREWLPKWFVEGNPAVKVGVVLLLMGVAFLLKYTAKFIHFPVEMRYLATLVGSVALVGFGWFQRERRPVFGQGLQAGGVGLAFLAVFAAFRLHELIPAGAAFALLAAISISTGVLAVLQSAQTLAVMGIAGGFMAPILASTGQGNHVMLFSYYAVLNLGIAVVARVRAWRWLNLLGFLFTFVIASAWGVLSYRADRFASTEPFLIFYFLFYVGLTVAFAQRRVEEDGVLVKDPVDATLAFGVPLVGFGLQAALVKDFAYGTAWSSAFLALFYGVMWLGLRRRAGLAALAETFLALGVGFATVTVPLALDAAWTSASWALEGTGLIWVGCRQQRTLSRCSGYLLLLAAGCVALWHWHNPESYSGWINGALFGTLMVACASWLAAILLEHWARAEKRLPAEWLMHWVLLAWGVAIWLLGGLTEIDRYGKAGQQVNLLLLWAVLSVLGWTVAARGFDYRALRIPGLALPVAGLLILVLAQERFATPLEAAGWLTWPLLFAALWGTLAYRSHELPRDGKRLAHLGGWWLLLAWVVWTLTDAFDRLGEGSSWPWLGGLLAAALALRLPRWLEHFWPVRRYTRLYQWWAIWPLAALLSMVLLAAPWSSSGAATPLPYLPLLNPLDLGMLLALCALWAWCRDPYPAAKLLPYRDTALYAAGALLFGWANAMLARAFHHFGGFDFSARVLLGEPAFQAGLSLLWSTVALASMFYATRRGLRALWITGAALIGLTVLKLFVLDLAEFGGLARIVSFIGVGLLLVGVGFFAPVPPALGAEDELGQKG
ncbi:DUF2339 domain-containing protein [Chitinimonas lacunae]|uniref:DUF2339 domain-containing protein n=1 Tax=Chitinimonas lacunae TaxID=1963018 RepID=A0ABV8MUI1_9NEIS